MSGSVNNDPDVFGTPGPDTILGGAATQIIRGDDGDDLIDGGGAAPGENDQLQGEGGNDTLLGAVAGSTLLDGGPGDDRLLSATPDLDTLVGGEGNDTIIGSGVGFAYIAGDDYADLFSVNGGNDPGGSDLLIGLDGGRFIAGGGGNDTIFAGGSLPAGPDSVLGGDGDDMLVLRGRPQDYLFTQDASTLFNGGIGFLSIAANGGLATENLLFRSVEKLAFGLDAVALESGEAPIALVDISLLFGADRPPIAVADTVVAPRDATTIVVSLADLFANDVVLDGNAFLLGFVTTTNPPIVSVAINNFPGSFDPALYPDGVLEFTLSAPLTSAITFQYAHLNDPGATPGNTATVTVQPAAPGSVANDRVRGNVGGEIVIPFAVLLANDSGVTITEGSYLPPSDGSYVVAIDRSFELFRLFHYGTAPQTAEFTYTARDAGGSAYIATVTVDIDNRLPIATDQTLYVLPGVANSFEWGDIVRIPANADPDGDALTLAFYNGSGSSPFGTLTGFGDADLGGITFTPLADYAGGFSIQYAITDLADLGGALPQGPYVTATLTFAVGGPLVARDDGPVVATIARAGFLTGNRVLANDTGSDLSIIGLLDDRGTADPGDDQVVSRLTTAAGTLVVLRAVTPGELGTADGSTAVFDLNPFGTLLGQQTAYAGPDRFTYVVQDSLGRQARASVSLDFANRLPVAVNDSLTVAAGSTLRFARNDLLANDSDPDPGQVLRVAGYAVQNQAGEGRLDVDPNDPNFLVYTPRSPSWTGSESFRYFITDDSDPAGTLSGAANALITFTVGAPPPVFQITAVSPERVAEGTAPGSANSFSVSVARVSGDLGAARVFIEIQGAGAAPVGLDDLVDGLGNGYLLDFAPGQMTATLSVPITLDSMLEPDETVRVTLSLSTYGGVDTTPFFVTILDDDLPPPIFQITAVSPERVAEGTAPGSANSFSINLVRVSGDLGPARVFVEIQGGGAVPVGLDDLLNGLGNGYAVDFAAGQTTATLSVPITPDSTNEPDETVRVALSSSTFGGVDPTPFFVTILDDDLPPPVFQITAVSPERVAEGTAPGSANSFSVSVARVSGDLGVARVFIEIQGAGAAPVGLDDLVNGLGNGYAVDFAAGQTTATLSMPITPDSTNEPDESVRVALSFSTFGAVDTTPFSVTILNDDVANLPPVALADSYTTRPGRALTIDAPGLLANDSDPNGDALIVGGFLPPANGQLDIVTSGSFIYTPNAGFVGRDSFTYRAFDGTVFGNFTTVTIDVVNAAPVAVADSYTVQEGRLLTVAAPGLLANDSDPDGDTLAVTGFFEPANGTVSLVTNGGLTYTPNPDFAGTGSFAYVLSDGTMTTNGTVTITVVEGTPVGVADRYSVRAGQVLTIAAPGVLANDSDPNGDALTVIAVSAAANGATNLVTNGKLTYTPDPGFVGQDSFGYIISDGVLRSGLISITIDVTNAPPVAVADSFTVQEGRTLTVAAPGLLANDSDPDGDALLVTSFFQPTNGTMRVVTDGTLTYTPNPGFVGTDSFVYRVSDGIATDIAMVTITVLEGNPVGGADRYSVHAGQVLTVPAPGLLANDSDPNGDPIFVIGVYLPANGTIDPRLNGFLSYTPNPGFVGQDSFTYSLSDGVLGSDLVTVTIDVTNAPPVAGADSYTVVAGRTLTVAAPGLLANDSDPDGDTLQVVAFFEAANGRVDPVTDGTFTYTPNPGFVGTDSFIYRLSDGFVTTDGSVTIAVVPDTSADLSVSLVINAAELPAGDTTDLVVRVDNAGPASSGGTVQLTPGLGVSFLGGGEGFDPATGIWTFGPIAAGGFAEFAIETLFATAGTPDIVAELVTASAPDPDSTPGNGIGNGEDDVAGASIAVTVPPASVALQTADVGSVSEGNAPASGALAFTILRSGNLDIVSTVAFTLGAGPGQSVTADDIGTVAVGGTGLGSGLGTYAVTFAPGEASRTISVFSTGDRNPEDDESIRLTLTGATGATLSTTGPLSATGTIANDDVYPTVGFTARSVGVVPEGDDPADGGVLTFTLARTGDLDVRSVLTLGVFLDVDSTNDDLSRIAWGGNGLGSTTGTYEIVFEPGQATGVLTVAARGDRLPEPTTVVVLELSPVADVTTNPATDTAAGGFEDDDVYPVIGWAATDAGAVLEGDGPGPGGLLAFTLTRTGDLSYASGVTFSVGAGAGGTTSDDIALVALGGTGLGSGFGTYTAGFAPGQASLTIVLGAATDRVPEQAEGVALTLLSATEGTLVQMAARTAIGRILNDDPVTGTPGPDSLAGRPGADTLLGLSSNDTLAGGGGADSLDGGAGRDIAVFGIGADAATWQADLVAGTWTVTSALGVTTLRDVEVLQFSDRSVRLPGAVTPQDLDGNGAADILWQAAGAPLVLWSMQGLAATVAAIGFVGPEWSASGTGDLDADGKADLLWRARDGSLVGWRMDGPAVTNGALIGQVDPSWQVAALADTDGDGKADILWRNADGSVVLSRMDGLVVQSFASLGNPGLDWQVAAAADLDGDGRADILWRAADGTVVLWRMDGATVLGGGAIGTVETSQQVAGTGDLDGDGRADILWRNGNGTVVGWLMDGTTVRQAAIIAAPGPDWDIAAIGDYDGDGRSDLLFRGLDGSAVITLMNGLTPVGGGALPNPGTDWVVL
ncbi:Ig-like domain-containing protein [Paracraurococcus ruber]|uniref:Tandem-95 repeat protein n=1 Tax=Paracraurococcus ruber TaxID=77675 RepID=A0ABS1CTE9_9PROT|nr:Ig-like domain-containing protein [Paracraurococcus ruber]MBK1657628.1 hypothetical protein [Paracraurococcus ruber]TDG34214.1 tandem-95 repeat protein [Paracraurococcus ruber]